MCVQGICILMDECFYCLCSYQRVIWKIAPLLALQSTLGPPGVMKSSTDEEKKPKKKGSLTQSWKIKRFGHMQRFVSVFCTIHRNSLWFFFHLESFDNWKRLQKKGEKTEVVLFAFFPPVSFESVGIGSPVFVFLFLFFQLFLIFFFFLVKYTVSHSHYNLQECYTSPDKTPV